MITPMHKQAIQELIKLVQSKMGDGAMKDGSELGDVEDLPQPEGDEPESVEEKQAESITGEEPEEGMGGADQSILEDMKKKFSGREDLNMPAGKKGLRIGMTEISAIPAKKMRR